VTARVEKVGDPSDSIGWVEFRWENVGEGQRYQTRVRFSEPIGALVSHSSSGSQVFSPAAMTQVGASLVVELGGGKTKATEDAYLLSSNAPARKLSFPRFAVADNSELSYLSSSSKLLRVALDRSGSVLSLGQEGAEKSVVMTVLPPRSERDARATLGYLGEDAGVFVPIGPFGFLSLAAFNAHPDVPPNLQPLPDGYGLLPCDSDQRLHGVRYLAPSTSRTVLPIRIDPGDGSALWLKTGRTVLYQREGSACWDWVESSDEAHQYSALLFGETPADSWLFRLANDSASPTFLYSKLECKRNESLEYPSGTAANANESR
jgi:hypothetical protein